MRRYWLLFAQAVTVALALFMVVTAVRPDWVRALRVPAQGATVADSVQVRQAPLLAPTAGSYRDAAGRAIPSVVNILTSKSMGKNHPLLRDPFFRRFFGDRIPQQDQSSLGSGVIVSPDGYILTNNHVVEAADEIEVVLADGRKAPAVLVGTDPETDLAVIRIKLANLPAIVLGRAEQARVGDVVLAIGNPFGVGQTVTMGIISALGRTNLRINQFENFIQTDAAINFGNSGGALIDTNGNLLGINTAIYSQTGGSVGIGFAIPVSTAKTVMEAIIRQGRVVRGWIGIESQDITPELAQSFGLPVEEGALIAGVVEGGPAHRAGLLPGDILLTVAGKRITNTADMLNAVAELPPGKQARMTLMRRNRAHAVNIEVGVRPPPPRVR
ncbi:trypsin-like peptidase domain-containing protein [Massilia sp. PAMC28688]|uniref:trypsin-like peptidase domain-containing protein n=1 Tax=Massilia sp. PAMC28688 TaxID=2861283 RepID=UPI001C6252BB|nr:trypsin-like peptidase domain-containing protein [Massilia sp. PAMC28688]QYF95011.1 trypsin-like peptidase domain-containing protein [Massilia sp. PAMC28688]